MRPRPLDDGQRQVLRADGREEARRAPRPARPGGLSVDKVLRRRVGSPNSQSIDTYVADGGYAGVRKVLTGGLTPEQVTEEVKKAERPRPRRRRLLRRREVGLPPEGHEGQARLPPLQRRRVRAGHVQGPAPHGERPAPAHRGDDPRRPTRSAAATAYIYIRGEFYDGARILNRAVEEAYAKGFLGENILGSGFSLDLTVHRGAGAYICGEETGPDREPRGQARPAAHQAALPRHLRRLRGADDRQQRRDALLRQARHRPRRRLVPEARPQREEHGPQALLHLGPREPPRRLRGRDGPAVQGPHLRRRPTRRASRAARSSRPSSRAARRRPCSRPEEIEDCPLDFDGVAAKGSMLGSAAIIVMDEDTCIVAAIMNILKFFSHESCGQCTPCREGTTWLYRVLARIEKGEGRVEDVDLLDARRRPDGQRHDDLRARRRRRGADPLGRAEVPRRVPVPRGAQALHGARARPQLVTA